jgi:hypothetical protein
LNWSNLASSIPNAFYELECVYQFEAAVSGAYPFRLEEKTRVFCRIVRETIGRQLASEGWPAPLLSDSGNGAHLLYPIDLPNDPESSELVKLCLRALWFRSNRCSNWLRRHP